MTLLRPLSGLLLALILALSSVTMAVARGQSPMGDAVEICGGFGAVFVTLDANGQPRAPNHPCPDCLTGVTALDLPGATLPLLRPQTAARAVFVTANTRATSLPPPQATARGPPSLI